MKRSKFDVNLILHLRRMSGMMDLIAAVIDGNQRRLWPEPPARLVAGYMPLAYYADGNIWLCIAGVH